MPFFPDADGIAFVVVVFFKGFYFFVVGACGMVIAFPVAYGVVVLVIADGLDFLVLLVARPFAVFFSLVVAPDHGDIAKTGPALEFAVRNAVVVWNFEFLDAVVVPFVPFEDGPVRIDPDGGLFDSVDMPCDDLFFGTFDGTAGETA